MRAIRKEQRLSLKELAQLTGLSVGYLSMLERNVKDPSIGSLRKISRVLNCSEIWLLVDQDTTEDHAGIAKTVKRHSKKESYVVREDEKLAVTVPGEKTRYMIFSPLKLPGGKKVRMTGMVVTVEKNDWVSEKMICHSYYDESIFIIQGLMELYIDDKRFELKAGDSAYVPENTLHNYRNAGDGRLQVLVHFSSLVY